MFYFLIRSLNAVRRAETPVSCLQYSKKRFRRSVATSLAKLVKLATRVFAFRECRAPECWIPPGGIDFAPPRLVFKLERVIGAGHIVFRVSGRIEFEHVATIERAIAGEKGPTALDLSDVTLVDRDVVPCLAR